ncbi:hypothetical protein ONZ43_g4245 [Nemania bipapillata]|uniref:Uncharacterized protein n=1 Tax=Nemania bipapillata TaxID=110536 RepID=A0ACC2IQ21_9PEZI|nr:hypothetical protein ONZ43_g4245 [Nemania bipapillata]
MTDFNVPFVTISSRHPSEDNGFSSGDSTSAARAFPNRGSSQRYRKVYVLLLHWDEDDLFVLPELEDLEICFQRDYNFETERFTIPSSNAHLDLMLKIGSMIKDHESTDTLLVVYYGGHARIDDARQSTWCASRSSDSPWLQWSAIQTLLERSLSDALILLDCCAGAASAAFPTGNSITETISASSWDAIAPDPGRYSFTSTLLEVLQEWRKKTFSVAMLHAEILARLKHPRPEKRHNGNRFEARTTPVHFMMTANHKAPSIELCRIASDLLPPLFPSSSISGRNSFAEGRASTEEIIGSEPNESVPHVMISLALEEDQNLNIDDWERWLGSIPALAKYVRVQGVFKSHSTLLLLSLPVMVWDMLPDHPACNFIAFIRSNNLATQKQGQEQEQEQVQWNILTANKSGAELESDRDSIYSGTTTVTMDHLDPSGSANWPKMDPIYEDKDKLQPIWPPIHVDIIPPTRPLSESNVQVQTPRKASKSSEQRSSRPVLPPQAEKRLEEYFINNNPKPTVAVKEFLASSLNIETADIDTWFRHRREHQEVSNKLRDLTMGDQNQISPPKDGARMILPGHLNKLLEIFPTGQIVVIDLRPSIDYCRSHIHGAINFRAPASFVSRASMEMIEKALTDEASRSSFDKWYTSKCVVFYDKVVEYPWEAPVAEAFFHKFKNKHWAGQCFVLKGVGGSVFSTMVGGVISDLYDKEARNLPMALFSGSVLFGTGLGPLISSIIVEASEPGSQTWKWVFWHQVIADFVLMIAVVTLFKESRGSVVLSKKAKALNKWYEELEENGFVGVWVQEDMSRAFDLRPSPPLPPAPPAQLSEDCEKRPSLSMEAPLSSEGLRLQRIRWTTKADEERGSIMTMISTSLTRPFHLLFTEPILFFFSLWVAFAWAVLYLTFGSIPLVFSRQYGFNIEQSGFVFSSMIVGSIIATFFGILQDHALKHPNWRDLSAGSASDSGDEIIRQSNHPFWVYIRRKFPAESPESRLYLTCFTGVLLPVGLYLFGFSAQPSIHWIVPTVAIGLATTGIYYIYLATFNYLADIYQAYASSALAAQSFCRNVLGGVFPLVTAMLFTNLGEDAAGGVLGAIATVLAVVPWVLVFFGERIRRRSNYAVALQK